jgi:hypothetical protein
LKLGILLFDLFHTQSAVLYCLKQIFHALTDCGEFCLELTIPSPKFPCSFWSVGQKFSTYRQTANWRRYCDGLEIKICGQWLWVAIRNGTMNHLKPLAITSRQSKRNGILQACLPAIIAISRWMKSAGATAVSGFIHTLIECR